MPAVPAGGGQPRVYATLLDPRQVALGAVASSAPASSAPAPPAGGAADGGGVPMSMVFTVIQETVCSQRAIAHTLLTLTCRTPEQNISLLLGDLGQPAEKDQHRFLQECVFFNHAVKHGDEVLKCARELCEKYGFKQELENLEDVWKKTKPQCDNSQLLDQERADKERAMKNFAEGSSAKGAGGISKKRKRSTDSSKHEVVVSSNEPKKNGCAPL